MFSLSTTLLQSLSFRVHIWRGFSFCVRLVVWVLRCWNHWIKESSHLLSTTLHISFPLKLLVDNAGKLIHRINGCLLLLLKFTASHRLGPLLLNLFHRFYFWRSCRCNRCWLLLTVHPFWAQNCKGHLVLAWWFIDWFGIFSFTSWVIFNLGKPSLWIYHDLRLMSTHLTSTLLSCYLIFNLLLGLSLRW
jgi:hypothetical protein